MIKKLLLLSLFCPTLMWGQEYLRKNLNEEGTTYIKASLSATFWARYYEANPHTQINGTEVSRVTDFSVRRLRINVQGQLTPKLYVYGLFGGNNYNFTSKNEDRIGILDLYADYQLLPELTLGLGKFGWNGSRNAMKASGSMMGLDAPSFPLFTVNKNDDAVRSLGAFAKGQIQQLSYVFTIKSPYTVTTEPKEGVVDYAKNAPHKQYSAHLKYDFWELESNKTPYTAGTYVGKKKVLNLAIGGVYQKDMMSELQGGIPKYYDYRNFSAELFLDTPLSECNDAITINAGYYYTDFGRDHIRYIGNNNGSPSIMKVSSNEYLNGAGAAYPMMGSGSTYTLFAGYLFGKSEKFDARIQPNISVQYSKFHGLNDAMVAYDLGANIFFKGHSNKLSFCYQNRPIYNQQKEVAMRKGAFIVQYHIVLN